MTELLPLQAYWRTGTLFNSLSPMSVRSPSAAVFSLTHSDDIYKISRMENQKEQRNLVHGEEIIYTHSRGNASI